MPRIVGLTVGLGYRKLQVSVLAFLEFFFFRDEKVKRGRLGLATSLGFSEVSLSGGDLGLCQRGLLGNIKGIHMCIRSTEKDQSGC